MAILGRLATVAALAAGGMLLKKTLGPSRSSGDTSSVEETVEVNVPVSTAYNQWTQFEEFPKFMQGVEEVRQLDNTRQHWRARIAGKEEEWDTEITSQVPDKRIAWRSTSGPPNSGVATFEPLSDNRTRITLRMTYRPPGLIEKIGDTFGAVRMQTRGDLKRFAEFIEGRGRETGAWRGTVSGGTTVSGSQGGSSGAGTMGTTGTAGTPAGSRTVGSTS